MSDSLAPLISVIVAVKNGEKTLGKCLKSLAIQSYKPVEIIIINDGSTDATGDIVLEFAVRHENIGIITTEGVGPSRARNLGISKSKGAYVAFTDGDCICKPGWLSILAECIVSSPRVAGVGGDQQSPNDDTQYGKFINDFMKTIGFVADYVKNGLTSCVPTKHNPTCNVLYRKAVLEEVGMFLPGLWPGEDVDLDYRIVKAGYQLRYAPDAVVHHYRPSHLRSFARMMYRYGYAQARLVRMHGFFRLIHLVPLGVSLALLASALMITNGYWGYVVTLCLASIFFAIIMFMLRTKSILTSARYTFHFIVTMLWWNAGFIEGLFYNE
jgi:glycosyltransferase involved in cell wall biosynthesis